MDWRDGHGKALRNRGLRSRQARIPALERLEARALLAASAATVAAADSTAQGLGQLTTSDVQTLLQRAAAATPGDNAIVVVVDRGGNVVGVRVEGNVSPAITGNNEKLVFSIDGAVSEARTGAFFANSGAPLTSRTIEDISQSTIIQQEVQSDPNVADPNSTQRGPGLVAPIGLKGHFPPRVMYTPQVDLFNIETTNRDSIVSTNGVTLPSRFNVPAQYIPPGQQYAAPGFQYTNPGDTPDSPPESYGFISGMLPTAQSRGIGTLPGGIPLYKNGQLVGGIGVFFPGTTGYATEENSALNDAGFFNPKEPDLAQEAEYVAFVAAGGSPSAGAPANTPAINAKLGMPTFSDGVFALPFGRIDLVGVTLDLFGGHGLQGPKNLVSAGQLYAQRFGKGDPNSGTDMPVDTSGDLLLPGTPVASGWLVTPHDSADGTITAADVVSMVDRGIQEANTVRSAIRLPLNSTAKMVFAVSDKQGNILGLYRMPDATVFSIAVAVAKARNDAYYADPAQLQSIDQVPGLPKGVAMTSRTFRYLAEPRYPEGIDGNPPGPFSILNDAPVVEIGGPKPASAFQSVQGYDAFNPNTNFHDPNNPANQNGVVFFPGSSPLYKTVQGTDQLVGGLGVSGDGVDQDDDVTYYASLAFQPPSSVPRADQVSVRGARLPYFKFNRQPHVPEPNIQQKNPGVTGIKPVVPNGTTRSLTAADIQRIETFNASVAAQSKHPNRTTGR
ncbi:MAG: heme-binding protein [Isosphaeraceae bacterium]|nr:heme-binding protein [Isosphaeraceae bacterium]